MDLKIVETSLNLRVERKLGKVLKDYSLSKNVAIEQLKLEADVYCNLEYMECNTSEYMEAFSTAGYIPYKGLDASQRGIMCMVKKEYPVKILHILTEPHMLHFQIEKEGVLFDIIIIKILVAGSDDSDYIGRKEQWERVLNYLSSIETKNLCIVGNYNHGVISQKYGEQNARRFFNYQMVLESLKKKEIKVVPINGTSYRGYLKIDHLCISDNLRVVKAEYLNLFGKHRTIGVPNHNLIVANLMTL